MLKAGQGLTHQRWGQGHSSDLEGERAPPNGHHGGGARRACQFRQERVFVNVTSSSYVLGVCLRIQLCVALPGAGLSACRWHLLPSPAAASRPVLHPPWAREGGLGVSLRTDELGRTRAEPWETALGSVLMLTHIFRTRPVESTISNAETYPHT